jgi:hypothetical protein
LTVPETMEIKLLLVKLLFNALNKKESRERKYLSIQKHLIT